AAAYVLAATAVSLVCGIGFLTLYGKPSAPSTPPTPVAPEATTGPATEPAPSPPPPAPAPPPTETPAPPAPEVRPSPPPRPTAAQVLREADAAAKVNNPIRELYLLQKAVRLEPQNPEAAFRLGRALVGNGQTELGCVELARARGLGNKSAESLYQS